MEKAGHQQSNDGLGHQQESLHCLGDVKDVGVRVQQDLQAGHRANGLHAGMKQFVKTSAGKVSNLSRRQPGR